MAKKYIDADLLQQKLIERLGLFEKLSSDTISPIRIDECKKIISIIDSLQQEQPEVDIATEYDEQFNSDPVYWKLANRNAGIAIARHFFELGKNIK